MRATTMYCPKEVRCRHCRHSKVDYMLLSHYEFSILSDHLNLTYIYNPLSADPTLARVVLRLKSWALRTVGQVMLLACILFRVKERGGSLVDYFRVQVECRALRSVRGQHLRKS
jgi:hypothetical protein